MIFQPMKSIRSNSLIYPYLCFTVDNFDEGYSRGMGTAGDWNSRGWVQQGDGYSRGMGTAGYGLGTAGDGNSRGWVQQGMGTAGDGYSRGWVQQGDGYSRVWIGFSRVWIGYSRGWVQQGDGYVRMGDHLSLSLYLILTRLLNESNSELNISPVHIIIGF